MHEWLEQARDRLATASGTEASALGLTDADIEALLDLARVASHSSGDRTNAPLVCYLLGRAIERSPGVALSDLVRAVSSGER